MSSPGSVTHWIHQLKDGDADAAQKLWEAYFHRLVGLARKRLQGNACRAADEEDVALSAFASFCRRAEGGLFPQLSNRDNLWQLLVVITARKAIDLRVRDARVKHGGGVDQADPALLEEVIGREPTPEFAAMVADECQQLLAALQEGNLRQIALWKMEGYTNEEIAGKVACAVPTVERRLRLIRKVWQQRPNS
jgi:DNA-directed RNA polymerase specialized sigma24 family protein